MVFLDEIDEDSGALEFKPTTHWRHFLKDDGTLPSPRQLPSQRGSELSHAYAAGEFLPVSLSAGSVVFRVPAVWHAVRPISRLRRYATARYCLRSERPVASEMLAGIREVVESRRMEAESGGAGAAGALWQQLGEPLRSLCDPDTVRVTPLQHHQDGGPKL